MISILHEKRSVDDFKLRIALDAKMQKITTWGLIILSIFFIILSFSFSFNELLLNIIAIFFPILTFLSIVLTSLYYKNKTKNLGEIIAKLKYTFKSDRLAIEILETEQLEEIEYNKIRYIIYYKNQYFIMNAKRSAFVISQYDIIDQKNFDDFLSQYFIIKRY